MTKARFKRLLALVVALSLFVCSAVTGFAVTGSSIQYQNYYFPYFTNLDLYFSNSPSRFFRFSATPSFISGLPYSFSLSDFSVSSSFVRFNIWGRDLTTYVENANSMQQEYYYKGIKAGSYTSVLTFSSSSLLSDTQLSSFYSVVNFYSSSASGSSPVYSTVSGCNYLYSVGSTHYYSVSITFDCPSDFPMSASGVSMRLILYFGTTLTLTSVSYLSSSMFFPQSPPYNDSFDTVGTVIRSTGRDIISANSLLFENLISYFRSQQGTDDRVYEDSVPDGLKQQQQEAQNQLTDYENKEQAVFDNLNTSLDGLKLNDYSKFSPSIVSSMTFINRYVTAGFDGLGDFKIILFLPMVIGIGLAVIGRMGHMISNRPTGKGRGP